MAYPEILQTEVLKKYSKLKKHFLKFPTKKFPGVLPDFKVPSNINKIYQEVIIM
jgi:hypothetical protein